jgi:hypothetical protein
MEHTAARELPLGLASACLFVWFDCRSETMCSLRGRDPSSTAPLSVRRRSPCYAVSFAPGFIPHPFPQAGAVRDGLFA